MVSDLGDGVAIVPDRECITLAEIAEFYRDGGNL